MRNTTPVLICDLDGTILRVNSFPCWILYLIAGRLPEIKLRARLTLSLRVQSWLLKRKFGRISHHAFMARVQAEWHAATAPNQAASALRVARYIRPMTRRALEPLLRRIAAGEIDAVLATAAAGEYALELGRQLGFADVLCTPCHLEPGEPINAGAQKWLRTIAFLASRDWIDRPVLLLTDHLDDLPLMRHADVVGGFGPERELARARAQLKETAFIDCRGLPDASRLFETLSSLAGSSRTEPKSHATTAA
jgi:phosphoserine phosphatase